MPNPMCVQCNTSDSLLWRSAENGQICNECHLASVSKESRVEVTAIKTEHDEDREDSNSKNGESTPAKATGKGTRKSTRATRYKNSKTPAPTPAKTSGPRGRGRRTIFKRPPLKAPTATATVVTSDSIFYKVTDNPTPQGNRPSLDWESNTDITDYLQCLLEEPDPNTPQGTSPQPQNQPSIRVKKNLFPPCFTLNMDEQSLKTLILDIEHQSEEARDSELRQINIEHLNQKHILEMEILKENSRKAIAEAYLAQFKQKPLEGFQ